MSEFSFWDEEDVSDHKSPSPPITPSQEQLAVVHTVCEKQNVVVLARSGAGKTTTSLTTAREFYKKHNEKTLLLTYNSILKDETRERIIEQDLQQEIEAHSYHAFATKYFCPKFGSGDDSLINASLNITTKKPFQFGLIIIDESQDVTHLYCKFIQHILSQCAKPPVMLLLGDPFQQIFRFAGADSTYMHNPEQHFGSLVHPTSFKLMYLSISYRITHEMAQWINDKLSPVNLKMCLSEKMWEEWGPKITVWWGDGIHANPNRGPCPNSVIYKSVNLYSPTKSAKEIESVRQLILEYGPENVVLLSKSIGSNSPLNKVVESLGRTDNENWSVLQGGGGSTTNRKTLMSGKTVASTIHKFKGLERNAVIVAGIDAYYEQKFTEEQVMDHLDLYNLFYVGATRAKDKLIIWNLNQKDYVTVRKHKIDRPKKTTLQLCKVKTLTEYTCFDSQLSVPNNAITCTPYDLNAYEMKCVPFKEDFIMIPGRIPGTIEDLTLVIGLMIELMVQVKCKHPLTIYTREIVSSQFNGDAACVNELMPFLDMFYELKHEDLTWPFLVQFAVAKFSIENGYIHYWRQINGKHLAEWTTKYEDQLTVCVENVKVMIQHLLNIKDASWDGIAPHICFWSTVKLMFCLPWFTSVYESCIVGEIALMLDNGLLVDLKVSSGFSLEHATQAQIYSTILEWTEGVHVKPIVMIPNLGEMYETKLTLSERVPNVPPQFDFLYRLAKRRLLMDTEDISTLATEYQLFLNTRNQKHPLYHPLHLLYLHHLRPLYLNRLHPLRPLYHPLPLQQKLLTLVKFHLHKYRNQRENEKG